mgnify:CR=1 FL=1
MSNASFATEESTASKEGLRAVGVSKKIRGNTIISDVTLQVMRGEAVALLGPNGAGKTTSFYSVAGLQKATSGRVFIDGTDVSEWPVYKRARVGLGYLPQEASVFRGLTVSQNIRAILEVVEKDKKTVEERLDKLLAEFGLKRIEDSPATALSGGERRRVEIARAMASKPTYILLDEPFAGVDPIAVADIRQLVFGLKERGLGVLITDHNVRETLTLVDRAYILHEGRVIASGTPDEIVSNQKVREVYLGENFKL